jgi:OOP family OmpA-OmpF porin
LSESIRTPLTSSSKAFALFVFAVLLLGSTRVAAENREGAFTLSPFAGGQGFPFGGESHYDADFDWGVRAGYNFSSRLGAELIFGTNKTVHDPEAQRCDINQYGADVLYFFRPDKKLMPFLAAGLGVLDVNFHGTYDGTHSLSDETNPYLNVGVGLEYGVTSWLGLRADFREAVMLNSGDQAMQGVLGFRLQL